MAEPALSVQPQSLAHLDVEGRVTSDLPDRCSPASHLIPAAALSVPSSAHRRNAGTGEIVADDLVEENRLVNFMRKQGIVDVERLWASASSGS
ncbi:MAG: hypothetical protein ACYC0X_19995 [Pirellulaceae bacterium]